VSSRPPGRPPFGDHLGASWSEAAGFDGDRGGDWLEAVASLRNHLARSPDDGPAQLRLAQVLVRVGEPRSARTILEALEPRVASTVDRDARIALNRLLATLDERAGNLAGAEARWQRVLGDDIDDAEAWAHLHRLGPQLPAAAAAELPISTLASPEGLTTSRYRLIRELGRGATATVYLVRDERLDLPLALKVLHPQFAAAARAGARARFFAEARLAAGLRHPGVVAIYDIDEQSRSLTMELVPGGTLRERLRRGHRASPEEVWAMARGLLETLTFVHDAGVVHGDLKPGNLLCRAQAELVLADFGAAEIAAPFSPAPRVERGGAAADPIARDDEPAGTPLYLAPERFRGAPPSPATDLFAAGMVLWELTTGHAARRPGQLLSGGGTAPIPPVPAGSWTGPARRGQALVAVIAALTAVEPAARPPSAAEALAALDA
jgi:hypothetical protein